MEGVHSSFTYHRGQEDSLSNICDNSHVAIPTGASLAKRNVNRAINYIFHLDVITRKAYEVTSK